MATLAPNEVELGFDRLFGCNISPKRVRKLLANDVVKLLEPPGTCFFEAIKIDPHPWHLAARRRMFALSKVSHCSPTSASRLHPHACAQRQTKSILGIRLPRS